MIDLLLSSSPVLSQPQSGGVSTLVVATTTQLQTAIPPCNLPSWWQKAHIARTPATRQTNDLTTHGRNRVAWRPSCGQPPPPPSKKTPRKGVKTRIQAGSERFQRTNRALCSPLPDPAELSSAAPCGHAQLDRPPPLGFASYVAPIEIT